MKSRLSTTLATVLDWAKAKDELAEVKPREMSLRLAAIAAVFGKLDRGTTRHDLGGGRTLNAELSPAAKVDQKTVQAAIDQLKAMGPVGELKAGRLFSWKAEVKLGEWKLLTDEERELFAGVVTIEDATPALELIEV